MWPLFFSGLSLISLLYGYFFLAKNFHLPLYAYSLFYYLTTGFGATLIGLPSNEYSLSVLTVYGIDIDLINNIDNWQYWLLLYLPLILPPILLTFFQTNKSEMFFKQTSELLIRSYKFPLVIITALTISYIVYTSFYLGLFSNYISFDSNYEDSIKLREYLIDQTGAIYFGLLYIGLPTLSYMVIYYLNKQYSLAWLILLLFMILFTSITYIIYVQKYVLVVYYLGIAIAFYSLYKKIVVYGILFIIMALLSIHIYQYLLLAEWSMLNTIEIIIFRVSSAFPFYFVLYPNIESFSDLSLLLGFDILGLFSSTANDNQIVFNYMYPDIDWTQGSVTTSGHMIAYSQAGIYGSILSLFIITGFIWSTALLKSYSEHPMVFALYIQMIILLYTTTQIGISNALLSSYGIIWAVLIIASIIMLTKLFLTIKREPSND